MRETLAKYVKILETAQKSDKLVQKRFEEHLPYIEALSASKVRL
jgi:hypothetical protein